MNELSWIIYLANTLPNFASALGILFGMSAFVYALAFIVLSLASEDWYRFKLYRTYIIPFFLVIFAISFTNLVPKKEAFYLIAASEMGERAIKTEEFKKLTEIINLELNSRIEKLKESK
jgi:hypothetical protein